MGEVEEETIEFNWGKKRGVGGKKKDVQFYESFTYDGVEYILFDSVYLYKEGEPEPYIGVGLANVNPLEALAGKCNVICISKDHRNPQPLDDEVQMADFVFYRTFDVAHRTISDKIDDTIAGIHVKFIFNKIDPQKPAGVLKPGFDEKGVSGNDTAIKKVVPLSGQKDRDCVTVKSDGKYVDSLVKESVDSKPSLVKQKCSVGGKLASSVDGQETTKSNGRLEKTIPQSKVKENAESKDSVIKRKSLSGQFASRKDVGFGETDKSGDRQQSISDEKAILRSKVDSNLGECEGRKVFVREVEVEQEVQSSHENCRLEEKPSKKAKMDDSCKVSYGETNSMHKCVSDGGESKTSSQIEVATNNKSKLKLAMEPYRKEEVPSKKMKLDENPSKPSNGKLRKESSLDSPNVDIKVDSRIMEVTRRPDADKSRWFRGIPWEERMKSAHDQGTLVLLQNLDPALTSAEVEDIVWHGFKENCTAKMVQRTAFSSPYYGQAYVIFKTREAAEMAVRKLDQGCLLLSNGRPLVASIGNPCFPEKKPTFYGHLVVDQHRVQSQRDMKDAVSTSHCSQPNNIEYDMAMEWCLLQERADCSWKMLYRRQGEEVKKLKAKLKSK
ncbi:Bromo-adjacent-like (BAH) domain protein [Quillaja saponaria]|uniref:Bromo-adjacent-like (BAH) domain protein n=1 Tax=Quillaja saponaria TaxID=32244 RepID=A0AAD7PKV1_QUISA|nr:Bromo-adjacent-like (BAH) domain protein [Quillaja saponaria]